MHEQDLSDIWTPKRVGECMVEAVRWARYNAGPTGPAAVRALYPTYVASDEDFDVEGWGLREIAGDLPEEQVLRRRLSPREVSDREDALHWPARYAVHGRPGSARILNLWLRCRVHKISFDKAIERRCQMSRASAYRMRDRALGAIAAGLNADGIHPW